MADYPNLVVVEHPLIRHKLTLLRNRETSKKSFRELVGEITVLIGYEVTRDLPVEAIEIETPLQRTSGVRIGGGQPALVPVLRAGLGMLEGMLLLLPTAPVGHIGLRRDHDTLEPIEYYLEVPPDPGTREFILLDPMLATGGSASAAIRLLKERGARNIRLVSLVAAPEGVARLLADHPEVRVFTAALDRRLDDRGYILPGLGDAGDRLFGTQ